MENKSVDEKRLSQTAKYRRHQGALFWQDFGGDDPPSLLGGVSVYLWN